MNTGATFCSPVARRRIYDQTGETDENLMGDKFTEVYDYFRALYKRVTEEDIDSFQVICPSS